VQLSERELATVLAALRYWQEEMSPHDNAASCSEHFGEVEPLTADEIDDFCERLNTFERRKSCS
jgi:hypothetical protein